MDLQDVFENFKIHLKDNVYAVLWSAWLRKDKSGLTENECQHILHTFAHAFIILSDLDIDLKMGQRQARWIETYPQDTHSYSIILVNMPKFRNRFKAVLDNIKRSLKKQTKLMSRKKLLLLLLFSSTNPCQSSSRCWRD